MATHTAPKAGRYKKFRFPTLVRLRAVNAPIEKQIPPMIAALAKLFTINVPFLNYDLTISENNDTYGKTPYQ